MNPSVNTFVTCNFKVCLTIKYVGSNSDNKTVCKMITSPFPINFLSCLVKLEKNTEPF